MAEFQHVNCMIIRIWEVKRVACYARAKIFTEAVDSVASMVAIALAYQIISASALCDQVRMHYCIIRVCHI